MVLKSFWLAIFTAFYVTVLPLDSAQAQELSPKQVQQEKILLQSYGYQPWEWQKSNCSNCELYIQSLHPDLRTELVHQVHVRVQAQVARVLDHPVGTGLAEVGGQLLAAFEGRAVFGVGPAGPQQQVAVVERVETTALLGP